MLKLKIFVLVFGFLVSFGILTINGSTSDSYENDENNILINHLLDNNKHLNNTDSVLILPESIRTKRASQLEGKQTSLVIVFDGTSSMTNDLHQMRTGAKYLVDQFHKRPENPISDYILVVFMDPAISPTYVTKNKDEMIKKLNEIVLNSDGNYDCPELSITGLINALNVAQEKAYVFLFTDAAAKDHSKGDIVLKLIRKKQPMITIFHTKDECSGDTKIHPLYNMITEIGNGLVYQLGREDISSVISSLDTFIDKNRVNLKYITYNKGGNNTNFVEIDASMDEFTFSISGSKPVIRIFDPNNNEYHKYKKLVNLANVQTIQVNNPQAGKWSVISTSTSAHAIKLSALSSVHFSYGFSIETPPSILYTSHLPLQGFQNILSISVSDSKLINVLDTAIVIAPSEEIVLPLDKVNSGTEEFYVTKKFILPNKPFKIFIGGYDKSNNKIERLLTPALATTTGENPETKSPFTKIETEETESVSLLCHVISLVPVKIQWMRESTREILAELSTSQGSLLNHTLTNLKTTDSGMYNCIATNAIGKSETTTQLIIRAIPLTVLTPFNDLKPIEDTKVILKCVVKPIKNVKIEWKFNDNPISFTDVVYDLPNIIFNNVKRRASGIYTCVASKSNGDVKTDRITLNVQYPPSIVESLNEEIIVRYGNDYTINCNNDGVPKPTKSWIKKIGLGNKIINMESINISNMSDDDEGLYICEVKNGIGSPVYRNVKVISHANAPPIIEKPISLVIKAKIGSNIELPCKCTKCGPITTHSWDIDNHQLLKNSNENKMNFEVKLIEDKKTIAGKFIKEIRYNLKIIKIREDQGGIYNCVLANEFGNNNINIKIQILKPPKITSLFAGQVKVIPPNTINIECNANGFPTPEIFWKKDGILLESNNVLKLRPNNLSLAGHYDCYATNSEGQDIRSVDVYPIVKPTFDNTKPIKHLYVETINKRLYIVCPFSGEDSVEWFKNGEIISNNKILNIPSVGRDMQGNVICKATNLAGSVQYTFKIDIQYPPINLNINSWYKNIQKLNKEGIYEVLLNIGDDFELFCSANGNPNPTIIWRKNAEIISMNEKLLVSQVKILDSGKYTCETSNSLGLETINYQLVVNAPPIFIKILSRANKGPTYSCEDISPMSAIAVSPLYKNANFSEYIEIFNGEPLELDCKVIGYPEPDITWFKNGIQFYNKIDKIIIPSSHMKDSGFYKCIRENIYGRNAILFEVNVLEKPSMNISSQIEKIRLGEQLNLKCMARGNTIPLLTWSMGGIFKIPGTRDEMICSNKNRLLNGEPIYLNSNGFNINYHTAINSNIYGILQYNNEINEISLEMIIPKVTVFDKGIYTCNGFNTAGVVVKQANVTVLVSPWFNKTLYTEHHTEQVILTFPINLKCLIVGDPQPRFFWYKDNKLIEESRETQFNHNERQLSIRTSKEYHSGFYECRAINEVGQCKMTYDVTVEVPFKIFNKKNKTRYSLIERIEKIEGESLTLSCPTVGTLKSTITWSKITYPNKRNHLTNSQIMHVPNVVETATYVCSITNSASVVEKFFYVNLQIRPRFKSDENTQNITVNLFEKFTLDCGAKAEPKPDVVWLKSTSTSNIWISKFHKSTDSQILKNSEANIDDRGQYTCELKNKFGSIKKTFNVDVIVKSKWSEWSLWTNCDKPCGMGKSYQYRHCLLSNGELASTVGATCGEINTKEEICLKASCPINGGWSEWENWSDCTIPCKTETEVSLKYRRRYCDSPAPQYGGNNCIGLDQESEICDVPFCPIDGVWSDWSYWSPCSKTCGSGLTTKTRVCTNVKYGGKECIGQPKETENCYIKDCPVEHAAIEPIAPKKCKIGYKYVKTDNNCQDIDECKENRFDPCPRSIECVNTIGSYICKCQPGYRPQQRKIYTKCVDIDECAESNNNCEFQCINNQGSYECVCPYGSTLNSDGKSCKKLRAKRHNLEQVHNQKCAVGFFKLNQTCIDVNECNVDNRCHSNEMCLNINGSFLCFPNICPKYFSPYTNGICIQKCDEMPSKTCMDNVKYAQSIQYNAISLTQLTPNKPIMEINGYSNQTQKLSERTRFTFDNKIDYLKFTMIRNSIKLNTMNLYVNLNIERNKVHTLKVTVKTYDSNGISILYLKNYLIYIYV